MSTHLTTPLFRSFSSALSWNAFAYLVHKSATTLRTFLLFYALSAHDFSRWATSMSAIFLLLLWLDLGLRKSIPRFAPLFSAQRTQLITTIIIIHLTILLCALPFLLWFLGGYPLTILVLAALIYLAQGTQSILRLAYHAYFLNKPFNLIASSSSVLELGALLCALVILPHHVILIATLIITAISSVVVCVMAYSRFFECVATYPHQSNTHATVKRGLRPFIKHSLIMWITTIIKSFSERNFLLLLITSSSGGGGGQHVQARQRRGTVFLSNHHKNDRGSRYGTPGSYRDGRSGKGREKGDDEPGDKRGNSKNSPPHPSRFRNPGWNLFSTK